MIQTELYLPPPLTPSEHASALGRLGGQARALKQRQRFNATARALREQLGLPADRRLA